MLEVECSCGVLRSAGVGFEARPQLGHDEIG